MTTQGYHQHGSNTSTLHKMKETYWYTKQAVMKRLGKKEDEYVVASDATLDAKLETFGALRQSTMTLLRVIEKYQDRLCALAQEENATGRFLKSNCSLEKTRAGKMMDAVGKSQSFLAHQRLALRDPLVRLYQEVETFRYRAISDTLVTVNRMEGARTEYRGALLWMKNVSEELDPDTSKQMDKFRMVQGQVRKTKQRFDRLKLDVMQKVDLLRASRLNMLSHVLASYQTVLLQFWENSSCALTNVADSFSGYQFYDFNMLKGLTDEDKKLAEENTVPADVDQDDQDDEDTADMLLMLDEEEAEEDQSNENKKEQNGNSGGEEEEDLGPFIDFEEEEESMTELEQEEHTVKKMMGRVKSPSELERQSETAEGKDQTDTPETNTEREDLSLLNDILNTPSTGEDGFTHEWQAVFGNPMAVAPNMVPADPSLRQHQAQFMPSSLMDTQMAAAFSHAQAQAAYGGMEGPGMGMMMMGGAMPGVPGPQYQFPQHQQALFMSSDQEQPLLEGQKMDMSQWFGMFADLDPLSNPDTVGHTTKGFMDKL